MYSFSNQFKQGTNGESALDRFFGDQFEITAVSRKLQRRGIDRIFRSRAGDNLLRVEYKTDYLAHKTGNAFIETVSVDSAGKRGWVHTSEADYLIYYVVEDLLIYVVAFTTLRRVLPGWLKRYPTKKAPNSGYFTHGLLVPLRELEEHAEAVISI